MLSAGWLDGGGVKALRTLRTPYKGMNENGFEREGEREIQRPMLMRRTLGRLIGVRDHFPLNIICRWL